MVIALIGASSAGKSIIEKHLRDYYGYKKIISYTTREIRDGETNGKDYYFTDNNIFNDMVQMKLFAEYDEYSKGRFYGTLYSDYQTGEDKVVAITPNGLRQLKNNLKKNDFFTILVKSELGTRMKRYIDRCGVDKFNFDDKNEICSRVERDYGMFLGLEKEVDLVVENNENTDLDVLVGEIVKCLEKRKSK